MHTTWLIAKDVGLFAVLWLVVGGSFAVGTMMALPAELKAVKGSAGLTLLPNWLCYALCGGLGGSATILWALGVLNGWLALGGGALAGFGVGFLGEKRLWRRQTPATMAAHVEKMHERDRQGMMEALVLQLGSSESACRCAAAEKLGNLGHAGAVPALVSLLGAEKDPKVLREAMEALGRLGDSSAIPALAVRLDAERDLARQAARALKKLDWTPIDSRDRVRLALAAEESWTLAKLAPQAVDQLLECLRDGQHPFRRFAVDALGHSGDLRVVPEIVRLLDDPQLQLEAAKALTTFGWVPETSEERLKLAVASQDVDALASLGPAALPALKEMSRPGGRLPAASNAARALGRIGGAEAISALTDMLHASWSGGGEEIRVSVTGALAGSQDPAASEVLIHAMRTGPLKHDKDRVAATLAGAGGASREALVAVVTAKDSELVEAGARALAQVGWLPETPEERLFFFTAARRWSDLFALGAIAADSARKLVRHEAPGLRRDVTEALGRSGDGWAAEILVSVLGDPVYAVRKAAAVALQRLKPDGDLGSAIEVKPTPGACAFCGCRLENIPVTMFLDDMIGRTMVSQGLQAADAFLRAACSCECGLPVCYACFKHGKWLCPDCGKKIGK